MVFKGTTFSKDFSTELNNSPSDPDFIQVWFTPIDSDPDEGYIYDADGTKAPEIARNGVGEYTFTLLQVPRNGLYRFEGIAIWEGLSRVGFSAKVEIADTIPDLTVIGS